MLGPRREERDYALKELWELGNVFEQELRKHLQGWNFRMHAQQDIRPDSQRYIEFEALSQEMEFNTLVRTPGHRTNYLPGWVLEA